MNNNLSNFNIENLFSNNKGKKPNFTGQLDIKSLFQNEDNDNNKNIDSKNLLETIYEKRNKLQKYYARIFNKCWTTIESANKCGFTKIKYEIPKFSECIGYSCKECLLFLKKKLEEQKLDVRIISEVGINISWEFLEDKIKKEENCFKEKQENFNTNFSF